MKYLPREVAFGKMQAMVEGAKIVRKELTGQTHHDANQAAVSRRSCRQPAALGAAQGSARTTRAAARSRRRQLKAVEDREIEAIIKKQEDVGLQVDHRRRVPPRLLELRFPGQLDGVEAYLGERKIAVPGSAARSR